MERVAWPLAAVLALAQGAFGWLAWSRAEAGHTVYVLTPMVDIVPGGAPVGTVEAQALTTDLRHPVDARAMQNAYARLGATLNLDDLLRGVEGLPSAGVPLRADQATAVAALLDGAKADHARVQEVQKAILDDEAELSAGVDRVLAALPPDVRARVEARAAR